MDEKRVKEIIESLGIMEVKYKEDPVWLDSSNVDKDGKIQVKDLITKKYLIVNIEDLQE